MSLQPLGRHSALEPAGIQAYRIESLFWRFFDVCLVVFVLVLVALVVAGRWREWKDERRRLLHETETAGRRLAVGAAIAVTTVVLIVLLVWSVSTGHALAALPAKDAVHIEVVAHQWWWEFRYPITAGGSQVSTAYEMHVPVGRPIELRLEANDVIHSFWVPSLQGKRDTIPGSHTTLLLQADEPGVYGGVCAEYCGLQHANMRFMVVAEPEADYQAWLAHEVTPAVEPITDQQRAGRALFERSDCSTCHRIGGNVHAFGTVGPNLTHLASRSALGMGTLPISRGHLAGWISDPQNEKRGIAMPGTMLSGPELQSLVAYLESLR